MTTAFQAGAVLYARNPEIVRDFYRAVVGLDVEHVEHDHVVLASPVFQLVVVRAQPGVTPPSDVEQPAARRETAAVKLVFSVPSIDAARALAATHGGALLPPDSEWEFQGFRVCDGQDPEGNVIQFRQCA